MRTNEKRVKKKKRTPMKELRQAENTHEKRQPHAKRKFNRRNWSIEFNPYTVFEIHLNLFREGNKTWNVSLLLFFFFVILLGSVVFFSSFQRCEDLRCGVCKCTMVESLAIQYGRKKNCAHTHRQNSAKQRQQDWFIFLVSLCVMLALTIFFYRVTINYIIPRQTHAHASIANAIRIKKSSEERKKKRPAAAAKRKWNAFKGFS